MKYALFIYEDESVYGPGKNGPAIEQIVSKHMVFNQALGAARLGGAGLTGTSSATTVRTAKGAYSTDRERCFHAIVNTGVERLTGHRCFTQVFTMGQGRPSGRRS